MNTTVGHFDNMIIAEIQALKNYALSLTHNSENANDLVQETLLKAYRYKNHFKEGTNLRGWLYTILRNIFINDFRRAKTRNTFLDGTDNTYFLDIPVQKTENVTEVKFISKDLYNAVDKLPDELRVTFNLNAEGFKYAEIAEVLGIPLGTVKTRIFVARRILRLSLSCYDINKIA